MTKTKHQNGPATHDCADRSDPDCRVVECPTCDIPPFCRNTYYTGKLLTKRDLADEQRYHRDRLRMHNLRLHGSGSVCGLTIEPHPHCPDLRLVLRSGFAIDGCGREIYVPCDVEIDLPRKPPPPPDESPCPPYERPEDPKSERERADDGKEDYDKGDVGEGPIEGRYPEGTAERQSPKQEEQDRYPKEPPKEEDPPTPEPCPPDTNLYVWICYEECETEFQPAPFDECACDDSTTRPNRICEGYHVHYEVGLEPPEGWVDCSMEPTDDCEEILDRVLAACPPHGDPKCVPLAWICEYEPGVVVTDDMIDNDRYRPRLPSTTLLFETLKCILNKLPTKRVTRIEDTNWSHEGERTFKEFYHSFVGDDADPRGFEITFSGPVRPEGLSEFTYQAFAVRHTKKGRPEGPVEAVPASVRYSPDRRRFYLRPDPDWAASCQPTSFDLYLVLHSDLIVDDRGCPVDGELQGSIESDGDYAIAFPTGDGLPGGRFVSWIRVLPDSWSKAS